MIGILAVIGFAGIVQFATGFGFALVSVPLLTFVTAPHQAVILALLVGTVGNLGQSVEGRRHIDRAFVGRILLGSVLGLPVGWLIFTRSDGALLQVIIGAITLAAVLVLAAGFQLHRVSTRVDLGTGLLVGVLTTCTGTNGPPLVSVLHARRVTPPAFRATAATVFLLLDIVAVAIYAATGHLGWDLVGTTALCIPGLVVGAWLGIRARRLLSPAAFRVLVLILLTATAITAIVTAG